MIQTLTRDIQYNDMVLSVMIYELYSPWDDVILSYGLFYCVGAVCSGVRCSVCLAWAVSGDLIWQNELLCQVFTHWENPRE